MLYTAPLFSGARIVVAVHDIAYEHYPQLFPAGVVMRLRMFVPLTIRRAAAVLTLSEVSKRDMVQRYCMRAVKVVCVYGRWRVV